MEQEFYVTLRVKTKTEGDKKVTEAGMKKALQQAIDSSFRGNDTLNVSLKIGDVIEEKPKR